MGGIGSCEWLARLDDWRCYQASSVGGSDEKAGRDPECHMGGRGVVALHVSCCARVGGDTGVSKFQVPYCYSQVYCCRIVQTRNLVYSRAVHLSVCWSALPGYSSLLPELSLTQSTIITENLGDVGRGHGWTCHIWAVVGFPDTGAILSVF
ncbi:hypothetical protein CTAM01_09403 [Colletotrichum tamarilloi]|uniref:Uncharacterized protein n=1 Tax=Colletotrichum tamarilloi TaxID=1209934 RepID=A0ABQ9R340_9PEZI|nr:uncharacterized protein CTAM01_09403 [Colletotrichum tamarilloi]KAK1493259.1 hypothetical protein CTAM01_09403 [Colletotrichum tamarilloi]